MMEKCDIFLYGNCYYLNNVKVLVILLTFCRAMSVQNYIFVMTFVSFLGLPYKVPQMEWLKQQKYMFHSPEA